MKLSCKQMCKFQEFLANLKCPHCFSAKVRLCEEEKDKNAACESCGCQFAFKPELLRGHE